MVMNDTAERIKNNLTLQNKSKVLRMIMKDDILSPKFWARKFEQPPFAAEQIVAAATNTTYVVICHNNKDQI